MDNLKKIITHLQAFENKVISDSDILYHEDNYPFTYDEYIATFQELDLLAKKKYDCTTDFEDLRAYFEYCGFKFIWRLLIGQGACCQVINGNINETDWPSKRFPMKFIEERKIIIQ